MGVRGAMLAVIASLAAAGAARAAAPGDDVQDILVLADGRPLLVRLQVTSNGAPFRQVWNGFLGRVFRELDRDGDEKLSADEASKCPPLRGLQTGAAGDAAALSALAKEKGGSLSREEFFAFQAARGAKAFVAGQAAGQALSNRALFDLIDANSDRQLSREELAAAAETLRQRDFNDDEVIGEAELRGARAGDDALLARLTATRPATLGEGSSLVVIDGPESGAAAASALLARYDFDGDGKLSCGDEDAEIALPEKSRTTIDADGDGVLAPAELARFAERAPDLELRFAFGQSRWQAGLDAQARRPRTDGVRISRRTSGAYKVDLNNALLEFLPNNRDPMRAEEVRYDFTALDADENDYLEPKEIENQLPAETFAAMDADNDGKVLRREFDPYVRRPLEAGAARVQFTFADQGRQFFEKLDDGDFRLTARELRRAVDVLEVEDRNGDGRLGAEEMPRHFRFDLARGDGPLGPRAAAAAYDAPPPVATAGPLWFQRMDANGDGDLSYREFLGSRTAFEKLDRDGDGLIDAEEAESG